jgi:hypothetical protein
LAWLSPDEPLEETEVQLAIWLQLFGNFAEHPGRVIYGGVQKEDVCHRLSTAAKDGE